MLSSVIFAMAQAPVMVSRTEFAKALQAGKCCPAKYPAAFAESCSATVGGVMFSRQEMLDSYNASDCCFNENCVVPVTTCDMCRTDVHTFMQKRIVSTGADAGALTAEFNVPEHGMVRLNSSAFGLQVIPYTGSVRFHADRNTADVVLDYTLDLTSLGMGKILVRVAFVQTKECVPSASNVGKGWQEFETTDALQLFEAAAPGYVRLSDTILYTVNNQYSIVC